jgi:hypothetical protein
MPEALTGVTTFREAALPIYRIQAQINLLTVIAGGVFTIATTVAGYLVVKTIEMSKFMGRTETQIEHLASRSQDIHVVLENVRDYLPKATEQESEARGRQISDK